MHAGQFGCELLHVAGVKNRVKQLLGCSDLLVIHAALLTTLKDDTGDE